MAINDGLTALDIRSLTVSPAGYVLAGTAGGGVFLLGSPTSVEDAISSNHFLEQNYPNPFSATTIVRYTLPIESYVSLKVFDLLGKEVAGVVDARQSPGVKTVQFDASDIASGVYIYKLQTGENTETRRMLIVR